MCGETLQSMGETCH